MQVMGFDEYKPVLAMVVVQCIYAGLALTAKVVFEDGMSPMVFIVYRQAIAALVLTPIAILAKGRSISQLALGWNGFLLVFSVSFIGITLNQYCYYEGINLSTSSIGTAMTNLIPAVTFVMAASIGLEKVKARSLRSMAKILGTIICIGGAFCMAFFKGAKLLNMEFRPSNAVLGSLGGEWMVGCLLLLGSACCWSVWLILQVPISNRYLDPLSLSVWMCCIGTFQAAIITALFKRDLDDWKITSYVELFACFFAGFFGSGVTFYLQAWSVSARGPLFNALFYPLSTIITIIISVVFLHEVLHIGSLVGAFIAILGLYIVLWGKAKDQESKTKATSSRDNAGSNLFSAIAQWITYEPDTREPLLAERSGDAESQNS